jgi:serine/threonine-protein kinase
LGTPAYSAPECIASGKFSPLSDQFSLAATLYEAISGQRAFPGEDAISVATRITTDDPPGIAEFIGVDRHVDDVLARGLAKTPALRFEDARAFGAALAEALWQSPRQQLATLPDLRHQSLAPSPHESRTARLVVGGAAVGALLGIAAFQLIMSLRESERPTDLRVEQVEAAPPLVTSRAPAVEAPKSKVKAVSARKDSARDAGASKAPPPEPAEKDAGSSTLDAGAQGAPP